MKNECTAEANYGSCWKEVLNKEIVTSCVDNFVEYQAASMRGAAFLPPLSKCKCSSIPGCWHDPGDGVCVKLCSDSNCLLDVGVCRVTRSGMPLALRKVSSKTCAHPKCTFHIIIPDVYKWSLGCTTVTANPMCVSRKPWRPSNDFL